MGAQSLSGRDIIGRFYRALETEKTKSWGPQVAWYVQSDQAIETYPFLEGVPTMREWIGGRLSKTLASNNITIANKHFEATIEFLVSELRRDKTGQTQIRIQELAARAAAHPRSLLTSLIQAGSSSLCYDGQFFFDTDHAGVSGAQSNSHEFDITSLGVPIAQQGTPTAPSSWTLVEAVLKAIDQHMLGLTDDAGEPMHELATRFNVMVPTNWLTAVTGASQSEFAYRAPNRLTVAKYKVDFVTNPRLTWTDRCVVMRTDNTTMKPFIYQYETDVMVKSKGPNSDYAFDNDACQFGVDQWANVAYGFWQYACLVRLV